MHGVDGAGNETGGNSKSVMTLYSIADLTLCIS